MAKEELRSHWAVMAARPDYHGAEDPLNEDAPFSTVDEVYQCAVFQTFLVMRIIWGTCETHKSQNPTWNH